MNHKLSSFCQEVSDRVCSLESLFSRLGFPLFSKFCLMSYQKILHKMRAPISYVIQCYHYVHLPTDNWSCAATYCSLTSYITLLWQIPKYLWRWMHWNSFFMRMRSQWTWHHLLYLLFVSYLQINVYLIFSFSFFHSRFFTFRKRFERSEANYHNWIISNYPHDRRSLLCSSFLHNIEIICIFFHVNLLFDSHLSEFLLKSR